jgi:cytochrome c oxidase subunit 2
MGLLLALLVWAVTLLGIVCVRLGGARMPAPISDAARSVDSQLHLTVATTGIAFVVVQGLLGFFVLRYARRRSSPARYVEGHQGFEVAAVVVVGIVFSTLAVMGQRVWAALHFAPVAPGAVVLEVTGEQFAWNAHYPGPDGVFGRSDPKLYDPTNNPLGLVPEDSAGRDDVVSTNIVVVPVDRPVELRLGSKDVLHSFFVPALRIKQDTVPGLRIPLRFTPLLTGEFEVPCAELCGLGHYRMKGMLRIVPQAEYETWLAEQASQ